METNLIRHKLVKKKKTKQKVLKMHKSNKTKSQDHVLSAKGLTRLTQHESNAKHVK